jgi:hypothetical protein
VVEVRDSAPVQTGLGVHTDSYTVGARIFPGGRVAGDVALTTHHI